MERFETDRSGTGSGQMLVYLRNEVLFQPVYISGSGAGNRGTRTDTGITSV